MVIVCSWSTKCLEQRSFVLTCDDPWSCWKQEKKDSRSSCKTRLTLLLLLGISLTVIKPQPAKWWWYSWCASTFKCSWLKVQNRMGSVCQDGILIPKLETELIEVPDNQKIDSFIFVSVVMIHIVFCDCSCFLAVLAGSSFCYIPFMSG